MLRALGAKRLRVAAAMAVVAVGGCGSDDFANDPGLAPEATVGAVVSVKRVTVSPSRVQAGLVELLASNQTRTSLRVQLRSVSLVGGGARLAQSTGPINPGGTATLNARLGAGTYVVSASRSTLEPATLVVDPPPSDPARLLQP